MRILGAIVGHTVPRLASPLLALSVALLSAPAATAQSFAVRRVRVFDGDQLHPGMTVVVQDGVIRSVQSDSATPPGTVLPGVAPGRAGAASCRGWGCYIGGAFAAQNGQ